MGLFHTSISSCPLGSSSCFRNPDPTGHTAGGIKTREDWRDPPNPLPPPDRPVVDRKPTMPNPYRFQIERQASICGWTVLMVRYPDATNYEGRKILVYRHPIDVILAQIRLDPHFCDNPSCISPVARFEPTEQGWMMAEWLTRHVEERNSR